MCAIEMLVVTSRSQKRKGSLDHGICSISKQTFRIRSVYDQAHATVDMEHVVHEGGHYEELFISLKK